MVIAYVFLACFQHIDEKQNSFQNVLVSSSNIVLHDTRDFVINGVSRSLHLYMKPFFYAVLTLIMLGVPWRWLISKYMVTKEYTICKQVKCERGNL